MPLDNPDNILIVDDNINNLQVLSDILQNDGFKVRPALSGELALRAIDAYLPDLILLDVRMPGMDGFETCKKLKSDKHKKTIPVIFISALNEIEDKLTAFRAGAVDYITKPFQSEEVLARVHTQMELAKTRKALTATNQQLVMLMEQLVQSEKLKSLGSLTAGVAHELNTPVGNAMLTADAIRTFALEFIEAQAIGASPPPIADLLATCTEGSELILRNLNRASKLIGSLKEVSVDQISVRRRQINLRNTVNDVITLMSGALNKIPYLITVDIAPELTLETCPGPLEQILENLIQNAIIHGFDGATTGTVSLAAHGTAAGETILTVSDTGKGIPPENLKRVFDPFFTTRLGQGGSGLGLHIAYSLTTRILGGSIGVTSPPGTGAKFTIILPRTTPADPV